MDRLLDDPMLFEDLVAIEPDAQGRFVVRVPRSRQRSGHSYDRLISRWRLAGEDHKGHFPLSHARYPSSVSLIRAAPPAAVMRGKKRLGD